MTKKKLIIAAVLLVCAAAFILWDLLTHRYYIDAFSGATPQALEKDVPEGLSLIVDGRVKQTYRLNSSSFRLLSKVRVRTAEITPQGEMMGAYIYTGVPLLFIMEGVASECLPSDVFDRPLDMVVTFTSANGQTAKFSYGELTMLSDSLPIILAFYREPLLPSKDPDKYTRNRYKENIQGLRLVCPRETDTSRFLDNVVRITLSRPSTPESLLPKMEKNKDCTGSTLTCISKDEQHPATYETIPVIEVKNWFRIGHGRGIKGDALAHASGYHLPSFLKQNFPTCGPDSFFLFVGCDGYRGLFSGREIFCTSEGDTFIMLTMLDGNPPQGGNTVAPTADFFLDRSVHGVTHIVELTF